MKRILLSLLVCASACTGGSGARGGDALGIAVVTSDFKSSAISLVNPGKGALSQDDCIDSGSVTASLSLALSGDIALPTSTQANDQLLLIDRSNSALDWIAPTTCKVSRQLAVGTGFFANPHDVVSISPTKAYVTRFETNPTPAGGNDGGGDLLIINPSTGGITGRIDLTSYATTAAGATIEARPDRALLIDGLVYVSLGELSADFKSAGAGRVAIIDPFTDTVSSVIELPGYKSCSQLDYVESTKTLVVGCGGDINDTPANQIAQSAIVLLDLRGGPPTIKKAIGAAATGGRLLSSSGFAVAGSDLIVAATYGDFSGTPPDALWALSLDAGKATKIADGDGSFVFGSVVWNASAQEVFVSDSGVARPLVRIFDTSNPAAVKAKGTFVANPKSGLPPQQLGWY